MPKGTIQRAAEAIRHLGQHTPRWTLDVEDGQAVVRTDDFGTVAFRIEGPWTADLIRLFQVFDTDALCALAAMLEQIPGSATSPRLHSAAESFVAALHLDGYDSFSPKRLPEVSD